MRPTDWTPVGYTSDPIPGDPSIVRSGGQDYLDVAEAIHSAERRLRSLDSGTLAISLAADALQEKSTEVADNVGRAYSRYAAVGNALLAYAPELESAQRESADALLSARSAKDMADDSTTSHQHYLRLAEHETDPAQKLVYTQLADNSEQDAGSATYAVQAATGRVHDAISHRDTAAETAISSIEDITKSDDLGDSWWDDWGKDVLTAITDIAGNVAMIAGVLALLVSWIPVVGQVLGAALLVVAGVAAVVNAIGNVVLASTGDRTWGEAAISVVGAVLSVVGMGAAVKVVGRLLTAEKVTMKVGQQLTVRQAIRLKPANVRQYVTDMRTPVPKPTAGRPVYRTYGGGADSAGGSWSPVDPRTLPNPRMQLGLPDVNTMDRVVVARLDDASAVLKSRHGLPYDGYLGGAPEYIIPRTAQPGAITVLDDVPFVLP
ncbi:putative T7SS-secreted protein [Glaciihabitans sp. dw_435]|uniref:putative T7SS-secreted protein n=1 Tax=Glaciihabitans sp. dw_435 TaxID=2720081 RepID=UPI001BD649EA|nr:hypothetical protein [Glaciihabitans sp. dw_435]